MGENNCKKIHEREISLVDLIIEILLHWRGIVLVMLVGGVLFAGYSYKQSYNAAEAQKAKLEEMETKLSENEDIVEADKQWLEGQLSDTQINNVKTAIEYEQMYKDKREYQSNNLSLNVDPYNVQKGEVTFLIKSDNMERTYNIQKVYEDMVVSAVLYEYVDKQCNLSYSTSQTVALEKSSYILSEGSDIVRIAVVYDDKEKCQQILDTIVTYVMEQKELMVEELGEHEVVVLSQSVGTIVVGDYAVAQKNFTTEIMSLRSSVVKTKDAFSDDEWRYYNYLTTGKASENPDVDETETQHSMLSVETIQEPSISMKYAVLGMILFAFVYVFYVFMKYILNNKLRSTESLTDIYNLPQLGLVSSIENKKKFLGFIDVWILSFRDRNKRKFTADEAINLAAVAVKIAAKKASYSDIYLVGCDIKNETADVCEKIKAILRKDGIEAKVLDNVLYNAESMAGLESAHCVVLVEKAGSTLYDEVTKELELLVRQEVTVLGGIVVE